MATQREKNLICESTFGERLISCVKTMGGPAEQEKISKWFWDNHKIKVSGAMINKYRNQNKLPRMEKCREYAIALDVCVDWLLTGREPKMPEGKISKQEAKVLDLWRSFPNKLKIIAYSQMQALMTAKEEIISTDTESTKSIPEYEDSKLKYKISRNRKTIGFK